MHLSIDCMNSSLDNGFTPSSKRPLFLLMAGSALFIVVVMAALAYGMSRPRTAAGEVQERLAVEQCWHSALDPAQSGSSRRFQEDACREMESQFHGKYPHQS
jgi:hypothetical protein